MKKLRVMLLTAILLASLVATIPFYYAAVQIGESTDESAYAEQYIDSDIVPAKTIADASLWEECPEQGSVEQFYYESTVYSGENGAPFKKTMTVYLPYGYNAKVPYNVLIMIPGMDMSDSCFLLRKHEIIRCIVYRLKM